LPIIKLYTAEYISLLTKMKKNKPTPVAAGGAFFSLLKKPHAGSGTLFVSRFMFVLWCKNLFGR
jgi:hypothetical protein